jgi:hypothetical protein
MGFRGWDRALLTVAPGATVEAMEPVIVSASRATDIPAFYAEWFMERLREGYVQWRNPFNSRQVQYISFRKTRVVVFWSKNPDPLLAFLPEIDARGINVCFQFTLNDYQGEALEPNLPSLQSRVDTFRRLAGTIGPRQVVWRFDPLVLTETVDAELLLDRIGALAGMLKGYTEKLVISFVDIGRYRASSRRLARLCPSAREFRSDEMLSFASQLVERNREWGFELATCGEQRSLYGIARNRCIDDRQFVRCFGMDAQLIDFLQGCGLSDGASGNGNVLKDKGQREACGCMVSKDIGFYNSCRHGCLYCYANR